MPRDVPLTNSIAPLRAKACKCSSAALADLNPSSLAISARVGGDPVFAMADWINSRICCWRGVSLGISIMGRLLHNVGWEDALLFAHPVTVFLTSFLRLASDECKKT
jgi:hypothetical protein